MDHNVLVVRMPGHKGALLSTAIGAVSLFVIMMGYGVLGIWQWWLVGGAWVLLGVVEYGRFRWRVEVGSDGIRIFSGIRKDPVRLSRSDLDGVEISWARRWGYPPLMLRTRSGAEILVRAIYAEEIHPPAEDTGHESWAHDAARCIVAGELCDRLTPVNWWAEWISAVMMCAAVIFVALGTLISERLAVAFAFLAAAVIVAGYRRSKRWPPPPRFWDTV